MAIDPPNGLSLGEIGRWIRRIDQERLPERTAVIEREQKNHADDLRQLGSELASLRRAIIIGSVSISTTLAVFSATIWAVFK